MSPGADVPAAFGRYEVRRLLGEGGYGRVWLAHDPVLARDVAVKVPRGDWWGQDDVLAEARALAKLTHPAIVQVLDAGRHGGAGFLVMELVDGEDLEALLLRTRRPVEPAAALELLAGPAGALDHAHAAGILHRDLKPGNILVPRATAGRAKGPKPVAKVTDFGLATLAQRHGPVLGSGAMGDPRHAAPEAWRGSADASSDIFSLATIFFRLVTGLSATPGTTPPEWIVNAGKPERRRLREGRPDLPAELEEVLALALSPRRHERPRSGEALLAALADAVARRKEREALLSDARERIGARERRAVRPCATCGKPLSPRADGCPFCGEG